MLLQMGGPGGFFFGFFFVWLLLVVVVVALSIIVTVQAYQAGREGWWVYLIAVFISPLNLVAVIAWFAYLKQNPMMNNGRPFL